MGTACTLTKFLLLILLSKWFASRANAVPLRTAKRMKEIKGYAKHLEKIQQQHDELSTLQSELDQVMEEARAQESTAAPGKPIGELRRNSWIQ